MVENQDSQLLRNTLMINGAFSLVTMLVVIIFFESSVAVREMANNHSTSFVIQSILFASFVFFNAFRKDVSKVMVSVIITLDGFYVLGSLLRIIIEDDLSKSGRIVIAVTAAIVLELAYFQFKGLRVGKRKPNKPPMKIKLFGLIATLLTLSTTMSRSQTNGLAPFGQKVDVGGYRLHLNIEGSGKHTVIIEAGVGEWSLHWKDFQTKLASVARVVTYDRAGYGYSDASPYARTTDQIAEELHTALVSSGLKPPYVLIGHSFGGMIVRTFTNLFRGEVEGLILAESASEDQFKYLPPIVTSILEEGKKSFRQASLAIKVGSLKKKMIPVDSAIRAEYWDAYQQSKSRPSYYETMFNEMHLLPMSYKQSAIVKQIDTPLLVITAGNSFGTFLATMPNLPLKECNDNWMVLQNRLPELSMNSRHVVIQNATHSLVTSAAKEMLDEVMEFLSQLE
jgi:pimeloyl-ACP methyl ester carboxylesterase